MSKKLSVEVTRGNLINAAGELAVEFGIDNVSTRLVAELARENIGSIHYHFGGKGGLFMAVVQKAIDGCVKLYDESLMSDLGRAQLEKSFQKRCAA